MGRFTQWSLVVLTVACGALGAIREPAAERFKSLRLLPRDEATADPSFAAFRERLLAALNARDVSRVVALLAPDVKAQTVDPCCGVEAFKTYWKLGAADSELWRTLKRVLALGGEFEDGGLVFRAPYPYTRWPKSGFERDQYAAVTAHDVNVRDAPALNAKVITRASFHIVKVPYGNYFDEWIQIVTPLGRKGYVHGEFLRNPLDFRATFRKIDGEWKLTSLVGGHE